MNPNTRFSVTAVLHRVQGLTGWEETRHFFSDDLGQIEAWKKGVADVAAIAGLTVNFSLHKNEALRFTYT